KHRRAPDCLLIEEGVLTTRSVHDKLYAIALDKVDDIGTTFLHFENPLKRQSSALESVSCALCCNDLEPKMNEPSRQFNGRRFVVVVHREEHCPFRRQNLASRELRLGKRLTKRFGHPHHLTGR